jgi:glycosyltransferase involved in cell wall biosynthesis
MENTIVLCMIVKNESKIITRCLSSVLDTIDHWVIVDTGSTDGTPEIIEDFFATHNIPGKLVHSKWTNFGFNRTESIGLAKSSNCDWILALDADMILKSNNFNKSLLDPQISAYQFYQNTSTLKYSNLRLLNTKYDWRSVGVTHEYLESSLPGNQDLLESLEILDIGDGGSKSDKFERDISLLTQGLLDEPNNSRYMFYLAQSYKDTRRFEEAIEWYKKRIDAGGWYEEVWYSYYMITYCLIKLGQLDEARVWANAGYQFYPNRAEALYAICEAYRENKEYDKAHWAYKIGKGIGYPTKDKLFIEPTIYNEDLFEYEYTILHYYLFPMERLEGIKLSLDYIKSHKSVYSKVVESNLRFYQS